MITGKLNQAVWERLEDRLTPLPEKSTKWALFHHAQAAFYLPLGMVTFCLDLPRRIMTYVGSILFDQTKHLAKDSFERITIDSRNWKEVDPKNCIFPKDFLWGTATCTYQDSGKDNCPDSQWKVWEETKVAKDNQSGKSADLFSLYQTKEGRDLICDRLETLGLNSYRFSIEWSHIEPKQGTFNETNLQVYVNLCKHLQDRNITPMASLHHFSEPNWFHKLGSFEKEENIDHFLDFSQKVFPALSQMYRGEPLVPYICTINEPAIEAFSRYIRGAFSPGKFLAFSKAGHFLKNMLKAHCIVYDALKQMNENVEVGIVHQRLVLEGTNPLLSVVVRYINRLVNDTVLHFFKTGDFVYKIPFSCHIEEKGLDVKTDFVGLQYYTRPIIGLTGSTSYHEPMTQMPFREDPEGLYEAICETHDAFNVPIIITENGISTHDPIQRARYLERALYATAQAGKKIGEENLLGYYLWSFCDNSEWDMGMKPQSFGAFTIEEDGSIALKPKEGLEGFCAVIDRSKEQEEVLLHLS